MMKPSCQTKCQEQRRDRQYESYILPMRADKCCALFSSPDLDMARVCPNFVKSHTCLKGTKGQVGSEERMDYHDGTFIEFKTVSCDNTEKYKCTYEIMGTNIECFKGIENITDTYRLRPITFCGCPFMQTLLDKEAIRKCDCRLAHQKTFCEWRTKFSAPIEPAQMEAIRKWKLNQLSDMLRDLAGEEQLAMLKRQEYLTDVYCMKMTTGKGPTGTHPCEPCTMEKAEKDVKRCTGSGGI